jgi:hypothetical protein
MVPVRLPGDLRPAGAPGLGAAAAQARPATIVLEGVSVEGGAMVEVALQGTNGRRVTVGVINSFNATAPRHEGMAETMPGDSMAFEATSALETLGRAQDAQLVLQPTTGVTRGPGLAADAPRVSVRFSAARLEVR